MNNFGIPFGDDWKKASPSPSMRIGVSRSAEHPDAREACDVPSFACSAASCAGFADQWSALRGACPIIQNAGRCARLREGACPSLSLIRRLPRVRSADATCPPCGARKTVRASLFLRFFDRCGNCALASSATGSARPQSPRWGKDPRAALVPRPSSFLHSFISSFLHPFIPSPFPSRINYESFLFCSIQKHFFLL